MKISYTWLKDYLEIDNTPEEIGQILTDLGLEVEGIEQFESVKGGLKGVVAGKVLTCVQHPNADKLRVTTVDIGKDEPVQIVCGAPNVSAGQTVPVATVGTTLYDKENGAWEIKKSKIRGEESFGMICAEDELGLGDHHDGIMVLHKDWKPGTPLSEVFEVLLDDVFEIGLTPNRSDAMSHYGVARDLRAGLIELGQSKSLIEPGVNKFNIENHTRNIPVEIEDSDLAPRYCSVTLSKISVKPSPKWLQNRLRAIGLSPVNNIVDATNYVMHALGQPFHAFDADQIEGQKIIVKTVEEGTKFTTLDGVERALSAEDLMICDTEKPLCIAGVYGGADSGVTNKTKTVFLESAYFNPVSVRKSAKRHGLNTDASFRFERGIDPNLTDFALKYLVILIQEIAGGVVSSSLNDVYPKKINNFEVFLRFDKLNRLTGQEIEQTKLKSILSSLDIQVKNITEAGMGLSVPAYRADVTREVDVIEEILRVYGYNRIHINGKLNAALVQNDKYGDHVIQKIIAGQLIGQGFYEIMSNSLTHHDHVRLNTYTAEQNVSLLNPLSKDLEVLRQSLLPGGLESINFNINRKNEDLRLFEFGKTYHQINGEFIEKKHLCLFATGRQQAEQWNATDQKNDFFFMKGVLQSVFTRLNRQLSFVSANGSVYSDGMVLRMGQTEIGHFGALRKNTVKKYGIAQEVIFADIAWDEVLQDLVRQPKILVRPIPRFPAVRRDFALLLDKKISFSEIEAIAYKTGGKLLKEVNLFDVYEGSNLPENKKSYAVSFTFLDENQTLTDKKIDKIMGKLRDRFEENLQAELR